jgi:hypothetical protein
MHTRENDAERSGGAGRTRAQLAEGEPPDWTPLERHIGSRCEEFMWMYRENGLEYYKHIDTRRYLILDANGTCYARRGDGLVPVHFDDEFRRVRAGMYA